VAAESERGTEVLGRLIDRSAINADSGRVYELVSSPDKLQCRESEIRERSREWLGVCGVARFARQILVVSAADRVAPRAFRRRELPANLRLRALASSASLDVTTGFKSRRA
jgi:hypothetical protein